MQGNPYGNAGPIGQIIMQLAQRGMDKAGQFFGPGGTMDQNPPSQLLEQFLNNIRNPQGGTAFQNGQVPQAPPMPQAGGGDAQIPMPPPIPGQGDEVPMPPMPPELSEGQVVAVNGEKLPDPSEFESDGMDNEASIPVRGMTPEADSIENANMVEERDIDITDSMSGGDTQNKPNTSEADGNSVPKPRPDPRGETITIKRGDTLWDLAAKYLGDPNRYKEIAELNNIPNPDRIYAGKKLIIPPK